MKTQLLQLKPGHTEIKPVEDTQFVLNFENYDDTSKYDVEFVFEKQGVECEILSVYSLGENDHLDFVTAAVHKVPNTACNTNVRGVLNEGSFSSYLGKIIIEKGAQQTSSFLDDGVLVLGENVVNRADPILEIEANDVKASHGSTTGRVNEEQVYYLQSRGLARSEAESLVIQGYLEAFISRIISSEVREQVKKVLFK